MQEQLISFKTAKLAKEKGFKWTINNKLFYNNGGYLNILQFSEEDIPAPTQSLLQKWLREVYSIHISILPKILPSNEIKYYCFKGKIKKDFKDLYDTYEEALEIGLKEGLKLIK